MEHYYVYCDGILGVKTNIHNFRWVYGSVAPEASVSAYERCEVRVEIYLKPERELRKEYGQERFQSYYWDRTNHVLSCRRSVLSKFRIGYDITILDGNIIVELGKNYYRMVHKRMMHLHGAYFLLADLANLMLLKKGYITMYASAVHNPVNGHGIVFFAPPNTGKTLTATRLCTEAGYYLLGEDIVIVKDQQIYACPWTASYRKKKAALDGAGAFGRVTDVPEFNRCDTCKITHLMVLSDGENRIVCDGAEVLRRIAILNGYLFEYYSSPIVKILQYFDDAYQRDWNEYVRQCFVKYAKVSDSCMVHADKPSNYSTIVCKYLGR